VRCEWLGSASDEWDRFVQFDACRIMTFSELRQPAKTAKTVTPGGVFDITVAE